MPHVAGPSCAAHCTWGDPAIEARSGSGYDPAEAGPATSLLPVLPARARRPRLATGRPSNSQQPCLRPPPAGKTQMNRIFQRAERCLRGEVHAQRSPPPDTASFGGTPGHNLALTGYRVVRSGRSVRFEGAFGQIGKQAGSRGPVPQGQSRDLVEPDGQGDHAQRDGLPLNAHSFGPADLLPLAKALNEAHSWIHEQMAAARNSSSRGDEGRRTGSKH